MADSEQANARGSKNAYQKTSRVYVSVGKYLQELDEKRTSLRSILTSPQNTLNDVKFVLPLLKNVVRFRHVIDRLVADTPLKDAVNVNVFLLRVAVYDQTFHGRVLVGSSKAIQRVKEHRPELDRALADYLAAQQLPSLDVLVEQTKLNEYKIPVYVRVNTIKTTTEDVLHVLAEDGYEQVEYDDAISYKSFIELVFSLEKFQFVHDLHIPDMFVFHVRSCVTKQKMVADGLLIIQNKASCFPPMLLNPPPDSVVMDCCAAPGMKTTYLAALMENEGTLLANDLSEKRAEQMRHILTISGATCAQVSVRNFLYIDPNEQPYCNSQYMLVDPSCSGTGIVNRDISTNTESPEEISEQRLANLSKVLSQILCHALKFPKVERIVYSTCSVHTVENEDVVRFALEKFGDSFELEEPPAFPFRTANKCFLKFTPEKDLTNGFFVAILQRKQSPVAHADDVTVELSGEEAVAVTAANSTKKEKNKRKRKRERSVSVKERCDANVVVKKSKKKKSKKTLE